MTGFEEDFAIKLLNIDEVKFEKNPIVCDVCHVGAILNRIQTVCIHVSNILKCNYSLVTFFRLLKKNLNY
jgi:hypothetical protein